MSRRKKIAFVSSMFIAIAVFVGLTVSSQAIAAVCPGDIVCVTNPAGGETWSSGEANDITLEINTSEASQYRLYLRCGTQTWKNARIINLQVCDFFGRCPSYRWSVPPIAKPYPCQIGVELLDTNFARLATATSGWFAIMPGPLPGYAIDPLMQIVSPGGGSYGGPATYTVSGGTPNYNVSTQIGGIDNFSHTQIDGFNSPATVTEGGSFTVTNDLGTPCKNRTVTIKAVDNNGAVAYAFYLIRCP